MTRLYAATGDGLARIEEDAGVWEVRLVLDTPGLQCVAADPTDETRIFAGSRGSGIWRSENAGEEWNRLPLAAPDVFSVAVSPVDGAVYAGCEPSMLFRSDDRGDSWRELASLRELPSAPTWSFPPRPWTSHVRWIAPSPHDAALLLLGIELGGLMRSTDGGETWADHRQGAQRDVHAIAWHPSEPGRAYEAAGGGAAWSRDGGDTWTAADEGRDRHYTWALTVDPADPDCWYVSASPGPMQAHRKGNAQAHIYRWRDDGPWQQLDGGLPQPLDVMPYALAHAGSRLFAALADGRLYASRDGGDTWKLELEAGKVTGITALAAL